MAGTLVEATRLGIKGFQGLEPRYNLLYREAEESLFPLARRFGLGTMVYNPLAGGVLTGKHKPDADPAEGTRFTMGDSGRVYRGRYWNDRFLTSTVTHSRGSARETSLSRPLSPDDRQPDVSSAIGAQMSSCASSKQRTRCCRDQKRWMPSG
jgi:hypothetical protein